MENLRRIKVELDQARGQWRRESAPNFRRVVGKSRAPLLESISRAAERPDADLVRDIVRGVPLAGSALVPGALLARSTLVSLPLEDSYAGLPSGDAMIARRVHPSSDAC